MPEFQSSTLRNFGKGTGETAPNVKVAKMLPTRQKGRMGDKLTREQAGMAAKYVLGVLTAIGVGVTAVKFGANAFGITNKADMGITTKVLPQAAPQQKKLPKKEITKPVEDETIVVVDLTTLEKTAQFAGNSVIGAAVSKTAPADTAKVKLNTPHN